MTHTIDVPQPFNLESVVKTHGWFQLVPFYWDNPNKALNWAVRLDHLDPTIIRITGRKKNQHTMLINFESAKKLNQKKQNILFKKFYHVFNLDLDLNEFYKICTKDSFLKQVSQRGMGRLMRCESVYEDIFKSICGTNVQWRQAVKMINTIAQIGEPVPGTEYRVFPEPEKILQYGETFLKDVGRVGYRSAYLMALCERMLSNESDIHQIEKGQLKGQELYQFFQSFKGIGQVTARYLAALYGSFENMAVDSLVLTYMGRTHFNGIKPTAKQIEDYYSKYGKWRYLAYWMEFILADGWNPDAA
jgi:3-methyladenine DNA glycosylase/8-oxoguanine DNA glycosylase